jgi:5'(3')-deoxyribonucleotidase
MLIAVDIDDVCAQLLPHWISRYNADYNDTLTEDNMTCWEIETLVKADCGMKIFKYLSEPDFYDGVLPVEGAAEGVHKLREMGHRVIFATSAHIYHGGKKFDWLVKHGFFGGKPSHKDYVEVRDKSLIRADVLIDDYMGNIEAFVGFGILMNRPHNIISGYGHYQNADNWEQIPAIVEDQARLVEWSKSLDANTCH